MIALIRLIKQGYPQVFLILLAFMATVEANRSREKDYLPQPGAALPFLTGVDLYLPGPILPRQPYRLC
ncbi:MAG: hypothetical protein A2V52_04450 [Actinobacteria bacterium RBG_19FT_COMBO_54_7]|uniref:Uncharacterized protein n=1 Tax=Candidatus Solincola sediminis TaxID=1797199 RepID=A0A1F2WFQ8_9ACTN|nr:MAG: hypothetical protein A2Y75_05745 [Candidatus Solincola sediminis]OFW58109.1 MAG: hypothetical protein A2W01_02365 [Candidatus Solincola sediminis]OFW70053.1 MAG: hypothetical protein A2V52_04450 [Actinobacteria bacterium RBG_19FT_COMBO_54_7]